MTRNPKEEQMRKSLIVGVGAGLLVAVAIAAAMMVSKGENEAHCCGTPELPIGSWVLTSWSDSADLPSEKITLTIDKDQVSGVSACNNYHGPVLLDDKRFSTGLMAQTMMFCADTAEAETMYLRLLDSVNTWKLDDDLILYSGHMETLRFTRA
jgi:heat shock protein HslJ